MSRDDVDVCANDVFENLEQISQSRDGCPPRITSDCSEALDLISIPVGGTVNDTTLVKAWYKAVETESDVVQAANFNTFIYQISVFVITEPEYSTPESKMSQITKHLLNYADISEKRKSLVIPMKIDCWGVNEQLIQCFPPSLD